MSRRYGGRFGGNSSEAYQRQLSAPVHKWKKAWVSPTGLQPESSYKICKWVRVDAAADDGSPAPDEDEDMDDGEEGDEVDGEDGVAPNEVDDGADDIEADGDIKEDEVAVAIAGTAAPNDPGITTKATPDAPKPNTPAAVISPVTPAPAGTTQAPAGNTSADALAAPAAEPPVFASSSPSTPAVEAAPPVSHSLPANAIEISNTAPHTTELGTGDLAGAGGAVITHGEASAVPAAGERAESSGMEVDPAHVPAAEEGAAVRDEADLEKSEAPEVDDGLIMGNPEPERKEFVVEGEDKPREVDNA